MPVNVICSNCSAIILQNVYIQNLEREIFTLSQKSCWNCDYNFGKVPIIKEVWVEGHKLSKETCLNEEILDKRKKEPVTKVEESVKWINTI